MNCEGIFASALNYYILFTTLHYVFPLRHKVQCQYVKILRSIQTVVISANIIDSAGLDLSTFRSPHMFFILSHCGLEPRLRTSGY